MRAPFYGPSAAAELESVEQIECGVRVLLGRMTPRPGSHLVEGRFIKAPAPVAAAPVKRSLAAPSPTSLTAEQCRVINIAGASYNHARNV